MFVLGQSETDVAGTAISEFVFVDTCICNDAHVLTTSVVVATRPLTDWN